MEELRRRRMPIMIASDLGRESCSEWIVFDRAECTRRTLMAERRRIMTRDNHSVVVLGGGPTGLAAGLRLRGLGLTDFAIFEAEPCVGGLSRSDTDANGFVWDVGGHVLFSRYSHFDETLAGLGIHFLTHQRVASVRLRGRRVPYPFQNHLRYLDSADQFSCLLGIADRPEKASESSFAAWIEHSFGAGISSLFMAPYNRKVWCTALESMDCDWVGPSVASLSLESALRNVILHEDDLAWGVNSRFRYPAAGGTGAIFLAMAKALDGHVRLRARVTEVDLARKVLTLEDGRECEFEKLISTMPLTHLVAASRPRSARRSAVAEGLRHNRVASVGIGFDGVELPKDESWFYAPGDDAPYYRTTVLSNYSPANTPGPNATSVMCEVGFAPEANAASDDELVTSCLAGLEAQGLLAKGASKQVCSSHISWASYAYPVPTVGWARAAQFLLRDFRRRDVISCGRFGGWAYERGNMDQCFAQGTVAAELASHELGLSEWKPPVADAHWLFRMLKPGKGEA